MTTNIHKKDYNKLDMHEMDVGVTNSSLKTVTLQ